MYCKARCPARSEICCYSQPSRRQLISCSQPQARSSSAEARSWLRADGGVPRQRLGQHFLVRGSILDRIAAAACPAGTPLVVEIGPGKGALTERLLARADRVIAIGLDERLAELLREKFPDGRLEGVSADVLSVDLNQWGPAVVAGELSFYITTA